MYDVAVIGAGPAGATLARLLAAQKFHVLLLEEHPDAGEPVNCSGIIGVEAFERYGLAKTEVIREISAFQFFSPGGATLQYRHDTPLAVAVHRERFDRQMKALAVTAGAEFRSHSRVTDIELQKDRSVLTINRGESLVSARTCVIATGAGSRLTETVGLMSPQNYVLGAQTEISTPALDEIEVHLGSKVAPNNFGWVIPLESGRAKVGLICETGGKKWLRHFISQLESRGKVNHHADPVIHVSLLPLEMLPLSYTDRTIVVGEAAGQLKTVTCGGIYYAMRAAEIGAEVLAGALKSDQLEASRLAEYDRRWKLLLARELQMGLRLRSAFSRLSDRKIDALFDIASKDGIMRIVREKVNFDWHYDLIHSIFKHSLVNVILQPLFYSKLLR